MKITDKICVATGDIKGMILDVENYYEPIYYLKESIGGSNFIGLNITYVFKWPAIRNCFLF